MNQTDKLMEMATALAEAPPNTLPPQIQYTAIEDRITVVKQPESHCYLTKKIIKKKKDDEEDREVWEAISTFTLTINHDEMDDDDSPVIFRNITLRSPIESWTGLIEPKNLSSYQAFQGLICGVGHSFHWYGTAAQFSRVLQLAGEEYIASGKVSIKTVTVAGWNPQNEMFLFKNCAIRRKEVFSLDEKYDSVPVDGIHYRLAVNDTDKENAVAPNLVLNYPADPYKLLNEVMEDSKFLWGACTEVLFGWAIAVLFRSKWMVSDSFPLCLIASPPLAGKNSLIKVINSLYGLKLNPVSLARQNVTMTSIMTMLNQMCNIPVHLDEYSPDTDDAKKELLKQNWDGGTSKVGTLNPKKTKSRRQRTGIILTGEFRANDQALNSRYVLLELGHNADPVRFENLTGKMHNLSAVTLDILKAYEANWKFVRDLADAKVVEWSRTVPGVDQRVLRNYSKVYAALTRFAKADPEREKRFERYLTARMESGEEFRRASNILKLIPQLMNGARGRRLYVPWGVSRDRRWLYMAATEMLGVVNDYTRNSRMSEGDFVNYARSEGLLAPIEGGKKPAMVSVLTAEGGSKNVTKRCYIFDLNNPVVREMAEDLSSQSLTPAKVAEKIHGQGGFGDET